MQQATPSTLPTTPLPCEHVETLIGTNEAIFDHLFLYIKNTEDFYNAFDEGFAGCPSIDVIDALGSTYYRWRRGGDRHKKLHDWKEIISDIRNQTQDKLLQERLVGTIHLKYSMKRGRAISTFAKLILEDKKTQRKSKIK